MALIPPVSGGAFLVSGEPLDLAAAVAEVARDDGYRHLRRHRPPELARPRRAVPRVRGVRGDGGADAVPAWEKLTAKHGLAAVAIHHRIGRVEIGEPSVVIAGASARHRAAALDACREAIDTLKGTIPLWKKEVYAGGEEWIGQGS